MQDRTIDRALAQVWRNRETGWQLAGAMLEQRGAEIPPQRRKTENRFRRRELQSLVLDALRGGPKRRQALVAYVAERHPELPSEVVYRRVGWCLDSLQARGLVRREGRLWVQR